MLGCGLHKNIKYALTIMCSSFGLEELQKQRPNKLYYLSTYCIFYGIDGSNNKGARIGFSTKATQAISTYGVCVWTGTNRQIKIDREWPYCLSDRAKTTAFHASFDKFCTLVGRSWNIAPTH